MCSVFDKSTIIYTIFMEIFKSNFHNPYLNIVIFITFMNTYLKCFKLLCMNFVRLVNNVQVLKKHQHAMAQKFGKNENSKRKKCNAGKHN